MPTLSIIIPVYNAATCIDRCLTSIVSSEPTVSFEIILVDDGSCDGSSNICDVWDINHPGIFTVIHQPNAGVSSARNVGMRHAKGMYLMFVDADDYVTADFWPSVSYVTNKQFDFVLFSYLSVSEGGSIEVAPLRTLLSITDMQKYILECKSNSPWAKLYRSDLAKSVFFPEGQSLGEDLIFNLRYLYKAKSFLYLDTAVYAYAANDTSRMSKSASELDALDYRKMYQELMSFCDRCSFGDDEIQVARAAMRRIISNFAARSVREGNSFKVVDSWIEKAGVQELLTDFRPCSIKDLLRYLILRFRWYALARLFLRGE